MDSKVTKLDKNMTAVTFAEAGEFEAAAEFLQEDETVAAAAKSSVGKKKPYGGMVIYGSVSLAGYFLLISNQKLVSDVFTMGGWHAAYPVLTALVFSFVHGAFASNLLTVLGIEAKK